MLLNLQTWPDIENYLQERRDIIIPIGSTEQHGPNGLLGTDAICAEIISKGVGEITQALVSPTLNVGMAQHHLAFPGTITLRPTTLIAVIKDYIQSLWIQGFEYFYFINGHGGNIATIKTAFCELYAENSLNPQIQQKPLQCMLRNWWEVKAFQELSKELYGEAEGNHATPSEISLAWYAYPEAARLMSIQPPIAPGGNFTDAKHFKANFPDGRIGSNPSLASLEAGKHLYETVIMALAEDYQLFRSS